MTSTRHDHSRLRSFAAAASAAVLIATLSTGCSDSTPSAEEDLCQARTDLRTAYDAVAADVRALNFGAAREGLPAINTALEEVAAAEQELSQDKRDAVQPEIDALQSAMGELTSATTLTEAGAALDSARSALDSAVTKISETADC
jgi:hypothetical protein